MTQEEKQLLLKDLCARSPHNVTVLKRKPFGCVLSEEKKILELEDIRDFIENEDVFIFPYLRPMSSMTEEEKNEIKTLGAEFSSIGSIRFRIEEKENDGFEYGYKWLDILDFLNAHHFDYRGLIQKGLALEASKETY